MYTLRKVNKYADYENETIGEYATLEEVHNAFMNDQGYLLVAMATRYILLENGKVITTDYR